ncbi:MAG: protein kinase [Gemmatimonadales bacterium]|nr:protein kinase [Gemmatimonadales bacterium]
MFCSRCGTEVQVSSRFCPTCGLDLTTLTGAGQATAAMAAAPPQPDEADLVREALKEEYELEKELGRGGMAVVFKARDKQLEREVAIKVLPFSLSFDAEFVERFQREARTAGKLEHPNIIPIYRVGKSGRVIYFVMKFIRGKSLSAVIEARGAMPVPEIKRVLIECTRALGYAHKHGIVHRDIKPDNIMFDEQGQAIVTDFGIAKAQSGAKLTGTGMSIGTPHYMSPEQARAQNLDGRSDMYSLGVVAYQCLTGHVPFDGEDSFSIGYKHIMEELPTPPLDTADQRGLFPVIQRMMAKKPEDRYQSAEELVQALEGAGGAAGVMSVADMSTLPTRAIEPVKAPAKPSAIASAATTPLPRASASMGKPKDVVAAEVAKAAAAKAAAQRKSKVPIYAAASFGVVALGLAGYYFGVMRPAQNGVAADTAAQPPVVALAPVSPAGADSSRLPGTAATRPGVAVPPASTTRNPDTSVRTPPVRRPPVTPSAPSATLPAAGQGTLTLRNVPSGAQVRIDRQPTTGTQIKLPVGRHTVEIEAQGFRPYSVRVDIALNQTKVQNVVLVAAGGTATPTTPAAPPAPAAPGVNCEATSSVSNPGKACYDNRPVPRGAPQITIPDGCPSGTTAATILLRVSADGQVVGTPTATQRGSCPAFALAAAAYAQDLSFQPATKNNAPVAAWTTILIRPAPRQ